MREQLYFSLRWSAVFAGLTAALLAFTALMLLGTAFAGIFLQGVFAANNSFRLLPSFTVAAMIWLVLSLGISLFVGSFFSARFCGPVNTRAAKAEGVLITSLFVVPLLLTVLLLGSSVKPSYRDLATSFGIPRLNLALSPDVSEALTPALDGLPLRVDRDNAQFVLAKRLARGQPARAYLYLQENAGVSLREAKRRIDPVRAQVISALRVSGARASLTIQLVGWLSLATLLVSAGAAMAGGTLGARPFERATREESHIEAGERIADKAAA